MHARAHTTPPTRTPAPPRHEVGAGGGGVGEGGWVKATYVHGIGARKGCGTLKQAAMMIARLGASSRVEGPLRKASAQQRSNDVEEDERGREHLYVMSCVCV